MKFVAFHHDYSATRAYGFAVMTDEQWVVYANKIMGALHVSYDEFIVQETPEDFLECLEVSDITKEEYDTLARVFNLVKFEWKDYVTWGYFPCKPSIVNDDETVVDEW